MITVDRARLSSVNRTFEREQNDEGGAARRRDRAKPDVTVGVPHEGPRAPVGRCPGRARRFRMVIIDRLKLPAVEERLATPAPADFRSGIRRLDRHVGRTLVSEGENYDRSRPFV